MSSASNFALVFLVARGTSPTQLGFFFLGYSILTAGIVLSRNAFAGIIGMDLPTLDRRDASKLVSMSLAAVLLTSVAIIVCLSSLALLLPATKETALVLVLLGVSAPVVLVQDLQRFWAVADGRPRDAVVSDGLWLLVAMSGFAVSAAAPAHLNAVYGTGAWVVGSVFAVAALMVLGYAETPRFSGLWSWTIGDSRRRNLAADALVGQLTPLGTMSLVAGVAGPQVLAAFRAAGTLFGPLNVLSATLPMALVPEAIRAGHPRAKHMFRATTVGFGAIAVVWGLMLYNVPEGAGSALLGSTFSSAQTIVLITMIEYVGLGLWGVSRARFRVEQTLGAGLRFRFVFSAFAVVLPTASVLLWGTAQALAASMAITAVGVGGTAYVASRHQSAK